MAMPPALRAYWAKKRGGSRRTQPRMARFARTRRAASAVRGGYRRFRGSRFGRRAGFGKVANGAITTVGARVGAQFLGGQWGPPAGMFAAGLITGDDTAQFMAGMALGAAIPLPGNFAAATPGGGYL